MNNDSQNLNSKQKEAVEHPGGPLLISAGAGSGKTRTLTSRILHLLKSGVAPENIVAITFTNKAANEMRERILNFKFEILNFQLRNLFIGTFHSLGAKILKAEGNYFGRTINFTIFDDDDALSLIKKITVKEMNLDKEQFNPLMFQAVISKTKNELQDEPKGKIHAQVFEKYEEALKNNNAFDFDDLIQKVVLCFWNQPEILKKYQKQWQQVLVDEFQDVNTSQYEMVKLLAQSHKNLSVVGDDFQAIYGFRQANYRIFLNFEKDWPNAKVVLLEENYRSTANIIQAANSVIKNNKQQKPKTLWTGNVAGELIKVVAAHDENGEAEWLTRVILNEVKNLKQDPSVKPQNDLKSIAILYRTNAQSRAVEQNLIAAGIPYKIFGGLRFYDRKEIKDIVAALRIANNPQDTVSTERLIKNLPKKITPTLIQELPRLAKELNILELINFFLNETNYLEHLEKREKNAEERIENINELIIFAGQFLTPSQGVRNEGEKEKLRSEQLPKFLEQISLASSAENPKGQKSDIKNQTVVNLMSIHLAKGLEFKTVFVIGCNEGIIPHHRSYDERDGIEEERRLMYVAMTRARENLYLSFYNLASRFLYEITPALTDFIKLQPEYHRKNYLDEEEDWIDYN